MKIVIFDVSNGSCALAVCNNGYSLMIDCGTNSAKQNPIDLIKDHKQSGMFLSHMVDFAPYGTKNYALTTLLITHPDDDHIRNVERVSQEFPPALLVRRYLEEFPTQSLSAGDNIKTYKNELCDKYRGSYSDLVNRPNWAFNRETFRIPIDEILSDQVLSSRITNNSSIVALLKYQGHSVLFGGDLETEGWRWLIENDASFREAISGGIDVLVAPHHGHKSAFPEALFEFTGFPNLTILSKGSEFGDGTDVDSRYSAGSIGKQIFNLHKGQLEQKYTATSRSNGQVYLDFSNPLVPQIYMDK